jgi:hypothetical protein
MVGSVVRLGPPPSVLAGPSHHSGIVRRHARRRIRGWTTRGRPGQNNAPRKCRERGTPPTPAAVARLVHTGLPRMGDCQTDNPPFLLAKHVYPVSTCPLGRTIPSMDNERVLWAAHRSKAEPRKRDAALLPGDGIPQGRVGRARFSLRRGEGPIPLHRRSLCLLPRARRLGAIEGEGRIKGLSGYCDPPGWGLRDSGLCVRRSR